MKYVKKYNENINWDFDEEEFDKTPPLKIGDTILFGALDLNLKVTKIRKHHNKWIFKTQNNNWFYYDEKTMKIINK